MSGKNKKDLKKGKSKKNMKQKKGVSLMIAYVLLITIGIALALLVYGWLKFYVSEDSERQFCPEETRLIIKEYKYDEDAGTLNVTVQNKGLFIVRGYSIKVHNRTGATSGFYTLVDKNITLNPGDEEFGSYDVSMYGSLTYVEVQPYITSEDSEEVILCQGTSSVKPVQYVPGGVVGCDDSDGGGNLLAQYVDSADIKLDGIVMESDSCSGNILTEWECNVDDSYYSTTYDCTDLDFICLDGECVEDPGSQASNLIAWYKFDELDPDNNVIDSSGNNHDGTIIKPEDVLLFQGMDGAAFYFKIGTDLINPAYVEIDDILLGIDNSNYSISVWIQPGPDAVYMSGGIIGDEKNQLFTIPETQPDQGNRILYISSGTYPILSGARYNYYSWQHYIVTVGTTQDDSRAVVTFYKNGDYSFAEWSPLLPSPGTTKTTIGWTHNSDMPEISGISGQFNGGIDDVKIFNKVLTAEEVKDIYQSYFPPVAVNCEQEDATAMSCADSCLSHGAYSVFGNWQRDGSSVYDGDWNTWDFAFPSVTTNTGSASFYVNYSAPCNSEITYGTWRVKVGPETREVLIPRDCFDSSMLPECYTCPFNIGNIQLKIESSVDANSGIEAALAYCWNDYFGWKIISSFENKNIYEESMIWKRRSVV